MNDILNHCIVTTEFGRLDQSVCNQDTIDNLFATMRATHEEWITSGKTKRRRIVFYAHGGMVSRQDGLTYAYQTIDWWMSNYIYPVFFIWETSPFETLMDRLLALLQLNPYKPLAPMSQDIARVVVNSATEQIIKDFPLLRDEWSAMIENALGLFIAEPGTIKGGIAATSAIERYKQDLDGALEIHLLGHSAGAFVQSGLLKIITTQIDSVTLLAPAMTVDAFERSVLAGLQEHNCNALTLFCLDAELEFDDRCSLNGTTVYYGSLLWLVARAFDWQPSGPRQVPICGMEYFLRNTIEAKPNLESQVLQAGGTIFYSPRGTDFPSNERISARSHGGMDMDPDTMNSTMLRILNESCVNKITPFFVSAID